MHRDQQRTRFRSSSEWALLADGSALFFGQRRVSPEKIMDYRELARILTEESGTVYPPSPAFFFTAADESNQKQVKFNEMIAELGWTVRPTHPGEANIINPLLFEGDATKTSVVRFDALISYALGRLLSPPRSGPNVMIASDSWALHLPILDAVLEGAQVTLAYFGSIIDPRWHRLFRTQTEGLSFLDLEAFSQQLFARPREKAMPSRLFER
jgi:hypothetical protein